MEHEKKKRQKKKKNKHGKTNVSVSSSLGDLSSENSNHINVSRQNHQNLNSETDDGQNKGLRQTVMDSDRDSISGAETSRSIEAEKSYWLNREASLELKLKELQEQLERVVSQSQKERNLWHHKEAELETKILQLQTDNDCWLQKVVSLEEKLTKMEEGKVNLAQRQNTAAETITSLNKDNARLRVQVVELEASRSDISHQNQQLKEHVYNLQSKNQDLENSLASCLSSERTPHVAENENMLESAQTLVEKLLSENERLVEKVNILNAELGQKHISTKSSLPIKPDDPKPSSAEKSDSASNVGLSSESKEGMLASDKISESIKHEVVKLKSNSVNHTYSEGTDLNGISRVSIESGEIVQIPLDENDAAVSTSTIYVPENADPVPLTDAPLIGAPFRFISFVARYVSGADLVQKS